MAVSPSWAASLAEEVAGIYEEAELRILRLIVDALSREVDDPWWERDVLARIQALRAQVLRVLQQVNPEAAAAIQRSLEEAYAVGALSAFRDLGETGVATAHAAAVEALAAATARKMGEAMPRILGAVEGVTREVIQDTLRGTITGTVLRRDALQGALNRLAQSGLTAIQVGRGSMGLADYARLALRTGTAQAMIEGHTSALAGMGLDLVTVRPGPRACEVCDDWAGKVLAVSGSAGTYDMPGFGAAARVRVVVDDTLDRARLAGWGHPNCRCSIAAYVPGLSSRRDVTQRPAWDAKGYQAQQGQRRLERAIREAKRREQAAISPEAQQAARRLVRERQARMRAHMDAHPFLKRQSAREQVMQAA